jgi:glycosyltransferase involved in cell wall biosynthesis
MSSPAVSIVTATFNRSNVLRLTIESVLRSTFSDWEMIVVGDACTDDTESVVAAFADPRIRFVNLPANHGEQSGPNNEGARLARGRYLAFLNHDDLWAPNHLQSAVSEMETSGAEFVHTLALTVPANGEAVLTGATREGRYEPYAFAPASTWVMRRELFERVGPWRPAQSLHVAPSVDWLFRAWKLGTVMKTVNVVTVVIVLSGVRKGSYAEGQQVDNERWATALRDDPEFLQKQLTAVAARAAVNDFSVFRHLVRAAKNVVRRVTFAAGFHPAYIAALLLGRRGAFINRLRKTRGLAPLPRRATS